MKTKLVLAHESRNVALESEENSVLDWDPQNRSYVVTF